jgi:hypothetical protein
MSEITEGWEAKLEALKALGARAKRVNHNTSGLRMAGKRGARHWVYRAVLRRGDALPGGRVLQVVKRDGMTMLQVVRWDGSGIKGGKGGAV